MQPCNGKAIKYTIYNKWVWEKISNFFFLIKSKEVNSIITRQDYNIIPVIPGIVPKSNSK